MHLDLNLGHYSEYRCPRQQHELESKDCRRRQLHQLVKYSTHRSVFDQSVQEQECDHSTQQCTTQLLMDR